MVLSDKDIKKAIKEKRIAFEPKLLNEQIGPSSVDFKLSNKFKLFQTNNLSLIDTKKPLPKKFMDVYDLKDGEPYILHPGDFVLTSTIEYMKLSNDLFVQVEGKSTLARMGILTHTAGFIDPGFEGTITLEISNQSNVAVALYAGMYICQGAFFQLTSPASIPYSKRKKSLYFKQRGPTEANTKNLF